MTDIPNSIAKVRATHATAIQISGLELATPAEDETAPYRILKDFEGLARTRSSDLESKTKSK